MKMLAENRGGVVGQRMEAIPVTVEAQSRLSQLRIEEHRRGKALAKSLGHSGLTAPKDH